MKISFTILLLYISLVTFSQGLINELNFNDYYNQNVNGSTTVNQYSYVAYLGLNTGFVSDCIIQKLDSAGNIYSTSLFQPYFAETKVIFEMIESESNGIYFDGLIQPMCDVISNCNYFIAKMDSNLNLVWIKYFFDNTC